MDLVQAEIQLRKYSYTFLRPQSQKKPKNSFQILTRPGTESSGEITIYEGLFNTGSQDENGNNLQYLSLIFHPESNSFDVRQSETRVFKYTDKNDRQRTTLILAREFNGLVVNGTEYYHRSAEKQITKEEFDNMPMPGFLPVTNNMANLIAFILCDHLKSVGFSVKDSDFNDMRMNRDKAPYSQEYFGWIADQINGCINGTRDLYEEPIETSKEPQQAPEESEEEKQANVPM